MEYLNQPDDIKVKVYDKILMHLIDAKHKEHRRRELLRVRVALKKIGQWILEAKEVNKDG